MWMAQPALIHFPYTQHGCGVLDIVLSQFHLQKFEVKLLLLDSGWGMEKR